MIQYESKKVTYCNVITTMIRYIVKKYDCSKMLIRSCYAAATVKLRSIITLTYISVIMNLTVIYVVYK